MHGTESPPENLYFFSEAHAADPRRNEQNGAKAKSDGQKKLFLTGRKNNFFKGVKWRVEPLIIICLCPVQIYRYICIIVGALAICVFPCGHSLSVFSTGFSLISTESYPVGCFGFFSISRVVWFVFFFVAKSTDSLREVGQLPVLILGYYLSRTVLWLVQVTGWNVHSYEQR